MFQRSTVVAMNTTSVPKPPPSSPGTSAGTPNSRLSTDELLNYLLPEMTLLLVLITGNVFVLGIIHKSRLWIWGQNVFIIQLIVCDLLRGGVMLAKDIYDISIDQPNAKACTTWGVLTVITTAIDAQAVAILFFDRLTFISNPVNYAYRMTRPIVVFLTSYNILQGLVVAIAPKTTWGKYDIIDGVRTCAISWESHTSFLVFFVLWTYIFPVMACTVCFVRALILIRQRLSQVCLPGNAQPPQPSSLVLYTSKHVLGIDGSLQSTARIMFIIYILFMLSWMPFTMMQLVAAFQPPSLKTVTSSYHVLRTLTFIGSAVNPWLYGLYNRRFRQTLKTVLLCVNDRERLLSRQSSIAHVTRSAAASPVPPDVTAQNPTDQDHFTVQAIAQTRDRSVSLLGLYNFPMELTPRDREWSINDPRVFKPRSQRNSFRRMSTHLETDMIRLSISN